MALSDGMFRCVIECIGIYWDAVESAEISWNVIKCADFFEMWRITTLYQVGAIRGITFFARVHGIISTESS